MAIPAETDTPMLSRESRIAQTVVFVDGIARTGKALIAPIIASFDRVEILRVDETLDFITSIYSIGKVSRDVVVTMIRTKTDINLYNGMIGRDTNFRFGDYSGVWKNPGRLRHLRRLISREGEPALQAVSQTRPIYQQTTHDQLGNFDLHLEAFGDNLRNVQVIRHPVDLIYSWINRNWGNRFGGDPLAFIMCFRHQEQDLPFYAFGWEDIYLSTSPTGRVIRMIEWVWNRNQRSYLSADKAQQQQVFFIPFEDFVQRPFNHLQPLAQFIGSATTKHTRGAVRCQNCPRSLRGDSTEKLRSIEKNVSLEESAILHRLIEEYETLAKECVR